MALQDRLDERTSAAAVDDSLVHASVRIATDVDVAVLASLRRSWDEEQAGGPVEDSAFAEAFERWWTDERASRTFFVVEIGGRPVGMANVKRYDRMPSLRRPGGSWGYVGNVFVLPEHRNSGVGRQLMEHLIRWAADARLDHLRLAPSPRSRPFYGRLGFEPGAVVELDPPRPG